MFLYTFLKGEALIHVRLHLGLLEALVSSLTFHLRFKPDT